MSGDLKRIALVLAWFLSPIWVGVTAGKLGLSEVVAMNLFGIAFVGPVGYWLLRHGRQGPRSRYWLSAAIVFGAGAVVILGVAVALFVQGDAAMASAVAWVAVFPAAMTIIQFTATG